MADEKKEVKKVRKPRKPIRSPYFLVSLWEIIKKDFKLLIRSKSSALVVLFGPLLIIFLVGLAFNTSSLYNIKVSTYSDSYSDLTNSVIDSLSDEQYIIKKAETQENCIKGVSLGEAHICVIFPPSMTIDNAADNIVTYHVDESRTNLAYILSFTISEKIEKKSSELSLDLTKSLVNVIDSTKTEIEGKIEVLSEIEGASSASQAKLEDLHSRFTSIDLTVEEINVSTVDDEMDAVLSEYNYSSSIFTDVNDAIDSLQSYVNSVQTKFETMTSLKDTTITEVEEAKTIMASNIAKVNAIKESLNKIKADIDSIKITNAESIVSPIKTSIQPITSKKTHLSFLFPTLIVLVLMFISILLASTIVTREKASPAYFRNFITPVSDFTFMLGTYITNLLLVVFQLVIIFVAAAYFLKEEIFMTILNSFVVLLIASTLFILIGMFMGYLFKSEETATLGSIAIGSIMLFFSNTILPIETIPGILNQITSYNPFVISQDVLKKVLLFNTSLDMLTNPLLILAIYIVIFFALSLLAREISKRSVQ